ncbi:hypothetical protein TCAL_10612 [Tigriopus californicus]|uniref:Peptidase S1 domain-containing protein n=1 Tax=Tigriopus californicus TaxID=6832 RepID=A0A553PER9_TIGCA|nr:brachyurin-like [Tigriopus californicus]TRY76171.1 hypothetical protein TCAL_10612 [Tigriopus californicus]|eukprot:TCALIF_10612-PA protein Name:"Similar to Chymotrypsin BII (Litopenaeus vannamei)" AED:0.12 eAED:0.12 QI:72/1/1/1/1/1/5/51/276
MKFLVVLALALAMASASTLPRRTRNHYRPRNVLIPPINKEVTKNPKYFGKIVGGSEAEPHSHPFIVHLLLDEAYLCGGSLIAPNVVVTAAHCTDGVRFVEVIAGAHRWEINEPSQQTQVSTNIKTNTQFSFDTLDNDVAVIILDEDFDLTDEVATIDLATSEPSVGSTIGITGWGRDDSGNVSPTLQEAKVKVVDDSEASSIYGSNMDWSSKICTEVANGVGTCNGDSGGPLYTGDGSSASLVGIVSFGASIGCDFGFPDCFTSVPSFIDWINNNS